MLFFTLCFFFVDSVDSGSCIDFCSGFHKSSMQYPEKVVVSRFMASKPAAAAAPQNISMHIPSTSSPPLSFFFSNFQIAHRIRNSRKFSFLQKLVCAITQPRALLVFKFSIHQHYYLTPTSHPIPYTHSSALLFGCCEHPILKPEDEQKI